ncbi:hypothetical protein DICVIV_11315 [Dictyocaulus viviparus]|uniref:Uncharacterized protein n=1 Tax=Dictyocaulus viviparus TaxID=29172 RepID=A0A0D8XK73_DICVI|nr:hypothetical protein DICVIV_11315 [Dictyocaulus viviparus]
MSIDQPNTSTYSPLSTVQKWPKSTNLLANHFETIKEFNTIYEQYRKLKILQRRNATYNSSINTKEIAERYVQNCEADIINTSKLPGFKPSKPMSMTEKSELVSYVEQILKERLKKAGINSSNFIRKRHEYDDYRLPVVRCEGPCMENIFSVATTSESKGAILSTCTVLKDVEQLLDEMLSFVTKDEAFNAVS